MSTPTDIAAARISDARRTTVLTGAGVSAASGVPTFRGAGGLWRSYRPEDLATEAAFASNPSMVWEWYDWRRSQVAACRPNRAHVVLADWSARLRGFSLVTQNVDGLHERAGTSHVTRLHGSLWMLRCWDGCGAAPWGNTDVPLAPLPPRCPTCGGLARPGVVWFNEHLHPADVARADRACDCDVFLVVGTAAIVYPAAGLAGAARRGGAFVIEVNPEPTGITSDVDLVLRGPAEVVLDAMDRQLPRI